MGIELKTKYKEYYSDLVKEMTADDSVYGILLERLKKEFDDYGLLPEQKADIISKTISTLIPQFEQLADVKIRELISLEADIPVKNAQEAELIRKKQAYDDNLLNVALEQQAGLTQFAVNSNSDSAQDAINDLKVRMAGIDVRVKPVCSLQPPEDLDVSVTGTTTADITWSAVDDATMYIVWINGEKAETTSDTSVTTSALNSGSENSITVSALNDTCKSELSKIVRVTTEEEV